METNNIKILAIESSCDETAAAVISGDGETGKTAGQQDSKTALGPVILSNVVSSQVNLHAKTGGVVPEVASRAHVEAIVPVIMEALLKARQQDSKTASQQGNVKSEKAVQLSSCPAGMLMSEITHIAVTAGPGLIGSLLVGFNAAKTLAYALDKPVVPINHIEGHIYSALAEKFSNNLLKFPALALVVSGGHTSLILMRNHGEYELIGQTLDDAAGEAFDKVAQLLDLGYPGGPAVSKIASKFRANYELRIKNHEEKRDNQTNRDSYFVLRNSNLIFPRPILNDGTFNFSFSGLKTAVLGEVKRRLSLLPRPHSDAGGSNFSPSPSASWRTMGESLPPTRSGGGGEGLTDLEKAEIATAFEDAAVDVLVTKTMRAVAKHNPKTVVLAGGVAANHRLREELKLKIENLKLDLDLLIPPLELCGDNAAMIGLAAYYNILNGKEKRWDEIDVDSNWEP